MKVSEKQHGGKHFDCFLKQNILQWHNGHVETDGRLLALFYFSQS